MADMFAQDIQYSDKATWQKYQALWNSGEYASSRNSLPDEARYLNANLLNSLTDNVVYVQGLHKDFKENKIQVSKTAPSGLANGQVYFEQANSTYTFDEVDALEYTFNDVDKLGITWNDADKGGW